MQSSTNTRLTKRLLLIVCMWVSWHSSLTAQASTQDKTSKNNHSLSEWVYPAAGGKLAYKPTERGDRIMDFSHAGYMGGGVEIPTVPVQITLGPSEGDNSASIQDAIDRLSKLNIVKGFRGAILLKAGTYNCEKPLLIKASGIVLRGSGPGANGTILELSGKPHAAVIVQGKIVSKRVGDPTTIADEYVPAGTNTFTIHRAAGFAIGDTIRITRPVTPEWIEFMGMHQLVRDGKKQTWLMGDISTDRVIKRIKKDTIQVSVPLNDSYDSKFTGKAGTSVEKITSSGEITQVGLENFRIVSPDQSVSISQAHHRAVTMNGIADGWAKNIEIFNTVNSVSITGKRITIDNISIIHNQPTIGAAKPADLNGSGSQLLFNRCYIKGDNLFFFGTAGKVSGPIVVLNSVFRGNGWIQPHMRWATGLLIDGCEVPEGGIDFMNRGIMGSGHGWAIGWAVAWNCKAKTFLNQQPPGSANWVIGGQGARQKRAIPFDTIPYLPEGIYDSYGAPVSPASLYLSQLAERLGKKAVKNIGYTDREISNRRPLTKAVITDNKHKNKSASTI